MLDIEDDATIGDHAILYCLGMIKIGKRSIVSQYAHLCAGTHDYQDHTFRLQRTPITIGQDVWILRQNVWILRPDVWIPRPDVWILRPDV